MERRAGRPLFREHPLCLRRPWWRSHPTPKRSLTYPSFTGESHPQDPLALNFMTVWAALALLSLFTLPWELSAGACSPLLLLREQFYWIREQIAVRIHWLQGGGFQRRERRSA